MPSTPPVAAVPRGTPARRTSSSSSHNNLEADDRRQLVRPTSHIPWSVEVVSMVPEKLVGDLNQVVAGATCPGWACLATRDGLVHVWPYQAIPGNEKLIPPDHVQKILFMDIGPTNREQQQLQQEANPLMAFSRGGDGGEQQTILLYAFKKPFLSMRKITLNEVVSFSSTAFQQTVGYTTKVRVHIEDDDDEVVSLTTAEDTGMVVLGTKKGSLYWVTCTTVPVGLHLQKVAPTSGMFSKVSRLFSSSATFPPAPVLQHVLPTTETQFLSLCSSSGSITKWDVTMTIASGHHATFEGNSEGTAVVSDLADPVILKAVLSSDHQSIHSIVRGRAQGETRLHWTRMSLDSAVLSSQWLSRFPLPDQVEVLGLSASANGNVYAAFSSANVVVVMMLSEEDIIQELDLSSTHVPSLMPNLFAKDIVTHGCTMLASSGIGIRVRYFPRDDSGSPAAKRSRTKSPFSSGNPATVHTLSTHLKSYFWQYYEDANTIQRPMPPSLKQSSPSDLEEAILSVAYYLQHLGDSSSTNNPSEWHMAFIKLLMAGGLYRSISGGGRWKLLSIGEELAAFSTLILKATSDWHQVVLKPFNIADWLLQIQSGQNDLGWPGNNSKHQWSAMLASALNDAMSYRDANAQNFYDIRDGEIPPEPLWLSNKSLQTVLRRQLEEWKRTNAEGVEPDELEAVVRATLCSFSESNDSKEDYERIKELCIGLLRSNKNDELAFDLSTQFLYFDALCQISVDHEKSREPVNAYSLDPLFETITGSDLMSGYSFPQFVLQWHTDRGMYGHTINYGRHSPSDLNTIMNADKRLRQYRWIPAIRQDFFDQATNSCLEICQEDNRLGPNHWALSMGKLCDMVAVGGIGGGGLASPNARRLERKNAIEQRLELVDAQKMLMEGDENSLESRLHTPKELIGLALKKLKDSMSIEDGVKFASVGLAVCTAMSDGNNDDMTENASRVWAECLKLNRFEFTRWLQQETDLTSPTLRDTILKDTVFGILLEECRKDQALSEVTYGRHIEKSVMDKFGIGESSQPSLKRLLRSVTAPTDSIQGESLVVASF